jgi:uncharacterized protein YqfA (UPF0365 family)
MMEFLNNPTVLIVVSIAGVIVMLTILAVFARFFRLYIQSITTGAGIGIFDLLRMTFRKVNPTVIVRSKIMATQAGITDAEGVTARALEAHYMAGGNVPLVIRSMIAARKAKIIDLDFKRATAIDLAGRNILEAVQTSVYPRVIDCPPKNSKRPSLDAIAKDGIQLKVKARVTVRANLNQLIGGATEETIVARVGDVGDNIGARLQADQAEADTRVARAQAEGRRAMAVSQEQENLAGIEEMRAKLVEAQSEIPKAMAEAFRSGKLGILDYYKMQNVQADTDMRIAIASGK